MNVAHFMPVFFKLFNFAVFATAVAWFVKRYGIATIKARMTDEQAEAKRLQNEVVLYAERTDACARELVVQQKKCLHTLEKVNVWVQVVEKEREQVRSRQEELVQSILHLKERQVKTLVWQKRMHEMMPHILTATEQELVKVCATPECQKQYVTHIFEHMKKS